MVPLPDCVMNRRKRRRRRSRRRKRPSTSRNRVFFPWNETPLANSKSAAYKFPETLDEQKAKVDEADALRRRGNELYKRGELMEAAKLYEQAVLKFSDWYADCFATDEEKELVHAVKVPAHLNLAMCSWKLQNYSHAVVHCTSALEREEGNPPATNAKAYYRRGACQAGGSLGGGT